MNSRFAVAVCNAVDYPLRSFIDITLGPARHVVGILLREIIAELVQASLPTLGVSAVEEIAPDRFRAYITVTPPADHIELNFIVEGGDGTADSVL